MFTANSYRRGYFRDTDIALYAKLCIDIASLRRPTYLYWTSVKSTWKKWWNIRGLLQIRSLHRPSLHRHASRLERFVAATAPESLGPSHVTSRAQRCHSNSRLTIPYQQQKTDVWGSVVCSPGEEELFLLQVGVESFLDLLQQLVGLAQTAQHVRLWRSGQHLGVLDLHSAKVSHVSIELVTSPRLLEPDKRNVDGIDFSLRLGSQNDKLSLLKWPYRPDRSYWFVFGGTDQTRRESLLFDRKLYIVLSWAPNHAEHEYNIYCTLMGSQPRWTWEYNIYCTLMGSQPRWTWEYNIYCTLMGSQPRWTWEYNIYCTLMGSQPSWTWEYNIYCTLMGSQPSWTCPQHLQSMVGCYMRELNLIRVKVYQLLFSFDSCNFLS